MGTANKYDVYDGSSIVLENVTTKEIQKHFGTDLHNIGYYTTGMVYFLGKYLITKHGSGQPEAPKQRSDYGGPYLTEEWKRNWEAEWGKACSRLRGKV